MSTTTTKIAKQLTCHTQIKPFQRFQLGSSEGQHCRVVFDPAEFDINKVWRSFKLEPPQEQVEQLEIYDCSIGNEDLRDIVQYNSIAVKISKTSTRFKGGTFKDLKKGALIDVICKINKYEGSKSYGPGVTLLAIACNIAEKAHDDDDAGAEEIDFS
jgi:hypothetical protein